jgi:hypothetical protein
MSESLSPITSDEESFYKYMGFGPHTRLSLFMLFRHSAIFFSHRKVLNDPTDCTPHLFNNLSEDDAVQWIKTIITRDKSLSDLDRESARSVMKEYGKNKNTEVKDLRGLGLLGSFRNSPKDFISSYMQRKVSDARVFSMSKRWDEPRMWAHYASSHSGFCLKLRRVKTPSDGIIFDQVDYTTRRPRISATEICEASTGTDDELKKEVYSRSYLQKSVGWSSEQEYRLILPADADVKERIVLDLPEGTYLRCPEIRVASVILGLNTGAAERDLFENHFFNFYEGERPSIFKITQTEKSYDLGATQWTKQDETYTSIFNMILPDENIPPVINYLDAHSVHTYTKWLPDVEDKDSDGTK